MNKREEERQVIFESLKIALLELMDKETFDKITISKLVVRAGIARSTFYRYFSDKVDLIRFLIQQDLIKFDQQYNPKTIKERFQKKYIQEVWRYLLKDKDAIVAIDKAGLSHIYLEEINKHLLKRYPYRMTIDEKINLFGLAGAQYNIIFNLFVKRYK